MSSRSTDLKADVAQLQKQLAELASSQAEMDSMRSKEKALFEGNKKELEEGLEGLKVGLKVLREYYSGEEKAHKAAQGAGESVIGLLEVVESDFSKTLAGVMTDESTAQAAYEKETQENEIEKATKERDVKYKTKESTELDQAVAEATSDLEGARTELSAILEYKAKLQNMCVAKPESYAERTRRRE